MDKRHKQELDAKEEEIFGKKPQTPEKIATNIIDKIMSLATNAINQKKNFNSKSCNDYFKTLIPDLSINKPTSEISNFVTKLLEKNGCKNKSALEEWINLRFGGNTKKYLLKISNFADFQEFGDNSLEEALTTLQTKLIELKKKLKDLSDSLVTLQGGLKSKSSY